MRYIKVFLTSAPTYLAVATVVVTALVSELVPLLPDSWAAQAAAGGAALLAIIAAVGQVIRRVTPVIPQDRGILPPPDPTTRSTSWT